MTQYRFFSVLLIDIIYLLFFGVSKSSARVGQQQNKK